MDANIVMTQFGSSCLLVYGVEQLKKIDSLPKVQSFIKSASRASSIVGAFLIHAGVDYTWNPVLNSQGLRTLTIGIPTISAAMVYLWHWFDQYAMQEILYQTAFNKVSLTSDKTGAISPKISPSGAIVVPPEPVGK